MEVVPDQYILHRWTLDCRYKIGNIGLDTKQAFAGHEENVVSPLALWSVKAKCNQVIEEVYDSVTDMNNFSILLDNFLDGLAVKRKCITMINNDIDSQSVAPNVNVLQLTGSSEITIRDPPIATTKGWPKKASRLKSGVEKALEEKKKKTCGSCGENEHYRTGCLKSKKVDSYLHYIYRLIGIILF